MARGLGISNIKVPFLHTKAGEVISAAQPGGKEHREFSLSPKVETLNPEPEKEANSKVGMNFIWSCGLQIGQGEAPVLMMSID